MPNHIHLLVRIKNETGGHRDPPLQFHFKCDLQKQNRPFLRSVLITHSELRIPHSALNNYTSIIFFICGSLNKAAAPKVVKINSGSIYPPLYKSE